MDESKIQEMQLLEQNLQNLLMQKQAFQMELSEAENALEEVNKAGDEVFKIVGQLMIKSDKKKVVDELNEKSRMFKLRVDALEKQEGKFTEKLNSLREGLLDTEKK